MLENTMLENNMIRRATALAVLCTALAACAPARARPLVELDVIDRERGDWLEPIRHRGHDWIAGEPGHRYGVRLTNTSGGRVLVVLSIDGVNAVTGQTAHPSQTGYVLGPWQSTEINGWRKSLDDIAQFVFTDLPDSYAARTGRPDNVGVIGIAVFEEARPLRRDRDVTIYPVPDDPVPNHHPTPIHGPRGDAAAGREREKGASPPASAAAAESAAAAAVRGETRQRLGTGHGNRERSPATRTGFARASRAPAQVAQLRYDDPRTLAARGIRPRPPHRRWHDDEPRAFPDGFVADPPQW